MPVVTLLSLAQCEPLFLPFPSAAASSSSSPPQSSVYLPHPYPGPLFLCLTPMTNHRQRGRHLFSLAKNHISILQSSRSSVREAPCQACWYHRRRTKASLGVPCQPKPRPRKEEVVREPKTVLVLVNNILISREIPACSLRVTIRRY